MLNQSVKSINHENFIFVSDTVFLAAHLLTAHLLAAHLLAAHLLAAHLLAAHLLTAHLLAAHLLTAHLLTAHLLAAHLLAAHFLAAHLLAAHILCIASRESPGEFTKELRALRKNDVWNCKQSSKFRGWMEKTRIPEHKVCNF